jgi:murein DD-endopeptidase MepM/ murein hydrolase activator NlpD
MSPRADRTSSKKKKDFNYVIVMHDDATFAEYCHLQTNGVLTRLGARVSTDTPIGLSGNTGFSTEPHLHFSVFNTVDGKTRATWPVLFRGPRGAGFSPEAGRRY